MRSIFTAALATTLLLGGCSSYDSGRPGAVYRHYDYNHPDPLYGGYDASRYYRDDPKYRERRMGSRDRIYRGSDDRYYCRRSDGSTGLIVFGTIADGLLGNLIARGGSRLLGTILGAGAGAAVGSSIHRDDARCR